MKLGKRREVLDCFSRMYLMCAETLEVSDDGAATLQLAWRSMRRSVVRQNDEIANDGNSFMMDEK